MRRENTTVMRPKGKLHLNCHVQQTHMNVMGMFAQTFSHAAYFIITFIFLLYAGAASLPNLKWQVNFIQLTCFLLLHLKRVLIMTETHASWAKFTDCDIRTQTQIFTSVLFNEILKELFASFEPINSIRCLLTGLLEDHSSKHKWSYHRLCFDIALFCHYFEIARSINAWNPMTWGISYFWKINVSSRQWRNAHLKHFTCRPWRLNVWSRRRTLLIRLSRSQHIWISIAKG